MLLTLAGIQFTHILDFMIMMPLGPQLTQLFAITDAQFGLLVSAYTLSAGASGLLASTYIDRFGRKRLLLVLYGLFGLATLACGLAPTYGTLMVARILAGTFGGVLSALSQTIVADVVPFERRGRAMGIVMTSFSVSTVAGVPLGLILAQYGGWHLPFIGIAAMVGVLAVQAARTLPTMAGHVQAASGRSVLGGIRQVLADGNHRWAFLFSALLMFTGFTVIPYITIYMQTNAGVRADQVPLVYLCGGVVTLFTARLFGRMTDRHGKVATFRWRALAGLPCILGITLVQGLPLWGVLVGVHPDVHLCQWPHDSWHGHHRLSGTCALAGDLHDAERIGAVGGDGGGVFCGRGPHQPRCAGAGAELLGGGAGGHQCQPAVDAGGGASHAAWRDAVGSVKKQGLVLTLASPFNPPIVRAFRALGTLPGITQRPAAVWDCISGRAGA